MSKDSVETNTTINTNDNTNDNANDNTTNITKKNSVEEIITLNDFSTALGDESKGLVIIDFFTTWCGPCKRIAPDYIRMAEKYPTVSFYKINAENENLANIVAACEIVSLPTFCFFKAGKYIGRFVNADPVGLEKSIVESSQ
ncbi:Thioredoxin [Acanthamoeba polyphaga mimivirus]|nr:Thioredoxin [Acanthamoeba castellanii mamavirus]EJN40978.1 hypothetical protein lvs_R475 [Acanthamoeba polyphaga lentillevirus]UMZ07921.1 Thioredoxin [Acanthamoeba polyphaga mimivirus]